LFPANFFRIEIIIKFDDSFNRSHEVITKAGFNSVLGQRLWRGTHDFLLGFHSIPQKVIFSRRRKKKINKIPISTRSRTQQLFRQKNFANILA
jgi:hypothetical protein